MLSLLMTSAQGRQRSTAAMKKQQSMRPGKVTQREADAKNNDAAGRMSAHPLELADAVAPEVFRESQHERTPCGTPN